MRGEVGAGVGLAPGLRPHDLARRHRRQEPRLLLVGADLHDRGTEEEDAVLVHPPGRAGAVVLLLEDQPVEVVGAAAAVLLRPRHRRPAALPERALPLAVEREALLGVEARQRLPARSPRATPAPRPGTPVLLGRVLQIHRCDSICHAPSDPEIRGRPPADAVWQAWEMPTETVPVIDLDDRSVRAGRRTSGGNSMLRAVTPASSHRWSRDRPVAVGPDGRGARTRCSRSPEATKAEDLDGRDQGDVPGVDGSRLAVRSRAASRTQGGALLRRATRARRCESRRRDSTARSEPVPR